MSLTVKRHGLRFRVGARVKPVVVLAPAKRGRVNKHSIVLTHHPEGWYGAVHQAEGWIARWQDGDYGIAVWAPTRKGAYSKAYRFMKGRTS